MGINYIRGTGTCIYSIVDTLYISKIICTRTTCMAWFGLKAFVYEIVQKLDAGVSWISGVISKGTDKGEDLINKVSDMGKEGGRRGSGGGWGGVD